MEKVSDFFTSVSEKYGKDISGKAFKIFMSWTNEDEKSVWGAFYEKSVLNDMLNYALCE